MFESSVIVANESLSFPRCKIDGSQNHTVIVGKGSNAGKPNNLWDLKDFNEEQQTGLMSNYH